MEEIKKQFKGGGLKSERHDNRDFSFGKVFGTIDLSEIPDDFIVGEPRKELNPNDYCTAFATTSASELQEGVELNPFWSFAVSKMISGDPESFGQQLHPALKVHTEYGAVEEKDIDYWRRNDYQGENPERYIENYPEELFEKAKIYKKKSFFKVDGYGNMFDSCRAVLWMNREKKQVIITGTVLHDIWLSSPDGIVRGGGNPMFGDAFIILGQRKIENELYLIAQLSADVGDNGKLYFPREIVNKYFTYGAYCFVDMPIEKAKKIAWSKSRQLWESIKKNIKKYLDYFLK